jgi:hypothetical protein
MPKQQLDCAHIGTRFQQMRCKGVPERMRRDRFKNPTASMRFLAGSLHGVDFYVAVDSITRKQPPLGSSDRPPAAQGLQKLWREHDIAVFAPLCVDKIYVAMAARRQWERTVVPFGGNITFACGSLE